MRGVGTLLLLMVVACNSGDSGTGMRCGPNGECPAGFECDSKTRLCVKTAQVVVDAQPLPPDAAAPDAMPAAPDAPVPDATAPAPDAAAPDAHAPDAKPAPDAMVVPDGAAPPVLMVDQTGWDFGGIAQGQTSSTQTFTVTNSGGAASPTLVVELSGDASFSLAGGTCAGTQLGAGQSCTVIVSFAPTSPGAQMAMLTVNDLSATLTGTGLAPPHLTIAPAMHDFGTLTVGEVSAAFTFDVTNGGDQPTSALGTTLSGAGFMMVSDLCQGKKLAAGATCKVSARFAPQAAADASANLTVAATLGGSARATLTGTSITAAALAITPPSNDFGLLDPGSSGAAVPFTVANTGDETSGTPVVAVGADFTISANGCVAPLAKGESCEIDVSFAPAAGGAKSATLDVSADPGGSVSATLEGTATFLVSVSVTGTGTVTSSPAGIACPGTCSAHFAPDTQVTLTALPTNGSGYRFDGWSGGCSGLVRNGCKRTLTADVSVGAKFVTYPNNLVFVSQVGVAANLGGAAAYDTKCNDYATAAGINNATNDAYVAWMSDSNSKATTRLGSARGFIRLDGEPFADDIAGLIGSERIMNPLNVDDAGVTHSSFTSSAFVWTGTTHTGAVSTYTCLNWTTNSGAYAGGFGEEAKGPFYWSGENYGTQCSGLQPIYCFMKTKTNALVFTPTRDKYAYFAEMTPGAGLAAANAACDAKKPNDAGTMVALLPLLGPPARSAASLISSGATYARPDGVVVGTGAEIIAKTLRSGLWQYGDGSYPTFASGDVHLTGTPNLGDLPTSAAQTCMDWATSADPPGPAPPYPSVGELVTVTPWFWGKFSNHGFCRPNTQGVWRIYCVEQ